MAEHVRTARTQTMPGLYAEQAGRAFGRPPKRRSPDGRPGLSMDL
jgi:hypothetical protein